MKTDSHLWQAAASFAARAHRHQVRKDGITPYVAHPVRVAMTIACVFGFSQDQAVLAAALLHDTIEDCGTDYDELLENFGREIADLVAVMTKDMRLVEPRRERAYDEQLARGPWQGRLLKLADVYDNLLNSGDASSRRQQMDKARRALKLTAGDRPLQEARRILTGAMRKMSKSR